MSRSSCISHPERESLLIIRKWQLEFCNQDYCAAALLSFFEYWYNWKLNSDEYNQKFNDIAEMHADGRPLPEDIYLFFTLKELSDGILGMYSEKIISERLKKLEALGVISIHANPNKKYCYDKTKYFRFYPDVCTQWIKNRNKSTSCNNAPIERKNYRSDAVKLQHRDGKNTAPCGKITVPITKITNKDINQSNNTHGREKFPLHENPLQNERVSSAVQSVVEALVNQGFPLSRLQYPDVNSTLQQLCDKGATVDTFLEAYAIACNTTKEPFGVRYLAKAVESILQKQKRSVKAVSAFKTVSLSQDSPPLFEDDFKQCAWVQAALEEGA